MADNGAKAAADIVKTGLSPKDLADGFCDTVEVDFKLLEQEFAKMCLDYTKPFGWLTKSKCLDFSTKILFVIGPQVRTMSNKAYVNYKFNFINDDNSLVHDVVLVTTDDRLKVQPVIIDNRLIMTINQAHLIATAALTKIVLIQLEHNPILLPPLAEAIFSKYDIKDLAKELLKGRAYVKKEYIAGVICSIISSCLSGGYYLPASKSHIAVCAYFVATKNMEDRQLAMSIIRKNTYEYISRGKEFDMENFKIYAKYARGGVPVELAQGILSSIIFSN